MTKAKEIVKELVDETISEISGSYEDESGIIKQLENQALSKLKSGLKEKLPKEKDVSEKALGSILNNTGHNDCLTQIHQAIDDYFREGE